MTDAIVIILFNDLCIGQSTCMDAAHHFLLSRNAAIEIVEAQLRGMGEHWASVCDAAELSAVERHFFWGRQFLNPYAFAELTGAAESLATLADDLRRSCD